MKKINLTDKIFNLTHSDLDGVGCSIVLSNVFKDILVNDVRFGEVDDWMKKINYDKFDYVLMTDLHPDHKESFISDKILMLDHHDTAKSYVDAKKMIFVVSGISATELTKRFCENYFKIDLSHLNRFCELVTDYDLWIHKFPESRALNELYGRYYFDGFRKRFYDGDITFNKEEINFLVDRFDKFKKIYDELEVMNFTKIKGCFIQTDDFVNDVCDKLLKSGYKIIINYNSKKKTINVRQYVKDLHMGNLLKELGFGGGHANAAGAVLADSVEELPNLLRVLEYEIYKRFEDSRR